MNFSAIPRESLMGRLARLPLQLLPKGLRVPILQGKLRGAWWIVGSSTHGCWLGSYEYHKRRRFEEVVKPGDVVYDIGANVGFYTLLASRLVGPAGRVVAFEPEPRNLAYLRRHLLLNGAANVAVVEAAVSDREGTLAFLRTENRSTGRLDQGGDIAVKSVTLDGFLARGTERPPDVIKMDIEGGELAALTGATGILRGRPTLFLATHGPELHRRSIDLLRATGYELEPLDGGQIEETSEVLGTSPSSQGT